MNLDDITTLPPEEWRQMCTAILFEGIICNREDYHKGPHCMKDPNGSSAIIAWQEYATVGRHGNHDELS